MSDTAQWTPGEVERLVAFMGWKVGPQGLVGGGGFLRGDGGIWAAPAHWNPFISADADLQVLERAREVWLEPAKAYMDTLPSAAPAPLELKRWDKFQRWLPNAWQYTAGKYAETVLAVLRSTENKP